MAHRVLRFCTMEERDVSSAKSLALVERSLITCSCSDEVGQCTFS